MSDPAYDLESDDAPPGNAARAPAFDLSPEPQPRPRPASPVASRAGCIGGGLTLLFTIFKLGSLGKFFLTFGSLFGSIWFSAVALGSGWALAAGIFLMILVHECGHALAARRFGLKMTGMIFTPFGGVVMHRHGSTNVVQDAFIGIMGPVAGAVYGMACMALGALLAKSFFFGLAGIVFLINLANLVPGGPLDGGWIGAVHSRALSPRYNQVAQAGQLDEYFATRTIDRIKYAFAWGGLALLLLAGFVVSSSLART